MRWALEYARLYLVAGGSVTLINVPDYAHQERVRAGGAGGASYHHAAPEQQQSNAAAATVVRQHFGPQVGHLHGTFGPLFREAALLPDDVFAKRAVAFAAFHQADLERLEKEQSVSIASFVSSADSQGSTWWAVLLADQTFVKLRDAAPVTMPSSAETAAAEGTASRLWRTPVDLYARAEQRALEISEGSIVAS